MACSHTSTCPLFPLISVNSALKVWKTFYCEGKYENCQRYALSRSGQSVPANLLPNGKSLDISGMTAATKEELKSAPTGNVAKKVADEMALIDLDLDIQGVANAPSAKTAPAVKPVVATAAKPAAVATDAAGDTSSWYLRIAANTDKGIVGSVIQSLGHFRIKIDAMAEKRMTGSSVVMVLIVLTDQTSEANLQNAISDLQKLETVIGPVKRIKLEHLSEDVFN